MSTHETPKVAVPVGRSTSNREAVSASKSALLLSPCLAWADKGAKWYEDEKVDTSARDAGTEFHGEMDRWLKAEEAEETAEPVPAPTEEAIP
jgi:hypothetical protein